MGEAPWTPWPPREKDFKEKHRTEVTEERNFGYQEILMPSFKRETAAAYHPHSATPELLQILNS